MPGPRKAPARSGRGVQMPLLRIPPTRVLGGGQEGWREGGRATSQKPSRLLRSFRPCAAPRPGSGPPF
eukprot:4650032-Pyramimonas_sp.AAC.1